MTFLSAKTQLISAQQALPGRASYEFAVPDTHFVTGRPIKPPFDPALGEIVFGMGCFWGAEEIFWQVPGVFTTAVGYAGGFTPYPWYEEVCSGLTGHTEVVRVIYDPRQVSLHELLVIFFEHHDPTQGYRQGNDIGTQYRSAVYCSQNGQQDEIERDKAAYSEHLTALGFGEVTTQLAPAGEFYYAEDYHQQYLAKNPNGYRCHATTGVKFPSITDKE